MEDERIIQILERREKNQSEFFAKLLAQIPRPRRNEVWVDGLEVQAILNITRRTVSRLINNGTLEPVPIGCRKTF